MTKLEPRPDFPDERSVLSNTLLVSNMILNQALNASSFSWIRLVYETIDSFGEFLGTGSNDYNIKFYNLAKLVEQGEEISQDQTTKKGK
ncbi:MAG: hypothetical protein E4H21_02920 [Thermodesulfobacteriales bacterium]|nr:MAG: hypothetical protein E4H21_02920 [Thermodesulfobacteriales bacterium]